MSGGIPFEEDDEDNVEEAAFIPRADAFSPRQPGEGVLIRNLKDAMCRWPLGPMNEVSKFFCGDPTGDREKSYCPVHSKIAYRSPAQVLAGRKAWQTRRERAKARQ